MEERTRVITAKITLIEKNPKNKNEKADKVKLQQVIKSKLKADDVVISEVKDFALEK